jgi:osmotically inducible lipoprotein OsmB
MLKIATVLALSLGLGACGSTPGERGLSGAGIGSATGAVIGAATGGVSILAGALIGAAVGGTTGALTTKEQINLGKPIWRWGENREKVAEIQTDLRQMGYYRGKSDGLAGPQTATAIRRYQREHNMRVTGQPSEGLYRHVRRSSARG